MSKSKLSRRIIDGVLHNFWLKFIALLFALGFYAVTHSSEILSETFRVKLTYTLPPDQSVRKLMSDLPSYVEVRVEGPSHVISSIEDGELAITLDLQSAQNIPHLELLPAMINGLPERVTIERMVPPRLVILFENIVSRNIQAQVARTGEPAKGMEVVGKTVVEPTRVVATGIESAVNTIQFARAEAIDVSGLKEGTHDRLLKLDDPPEHVSYDRNTVKATVVIARKLATRRFEKLKLEVVGLTRARLKPDTVTIEITGAPEIVAALHRDAIVPRVEPKAAGEDVTQPGSANLRVLVNVPDLIVVITPKNVFVSW